MATGSRDPPSDAALARDMMSLNKLLARPLTRTLLDEWKGSIKNLHLFEGIVFGSIRWLKTMDRLLTPTHADAFEIRLSHMQTVPDHEPDGVHLITIPAPDLPPSKWDGPDNDEYYRVSFMTSGLVAQRIYSLDVSFTAQARWEVSRNPLMRRVYSIEPLGREFSVDDISFLDPFEVKHRIVMP